MFKNMGLVTGLGMGEKVTVSFLNICPTKKKYAAEVSFSHRSGVLTQLAGAPGNALH